MAPITMQPVSSSDASGGVPQWNLPEQAREFWEKLESGETIRVKKAHGA